MDFFDIVDEDYGVDNEGPEPYDEEGTVTVPRQDFKLQSTDLHQLLHAIDPLSSSDSYGIDLYEQTIQFINQL